MTIDWASLGLGIVVGGGIVGAMPAFRPINRVQTPWWAKRILNRLDDIVATLTEAVQGWRDYTADLKAQRDAAVTALAEANDRAQTAATALADFQANDAETDAQQLADQAKADADFVQSALDEVKTPPEQPPVVDQPIDGIPATETPDPADETPVSEPEPEPATDLPPVEDDEDVTGTPEPTTETPADDPEATPPSESPNPLA